MTLDDAIEKLYAAFAGEVKPTSVEACECCIGEHELNDLIKINLRDLTAKQLSNYASSAFLTAGSERDFRYFIPRILDLSLHGKFDCPDHEVICRSLRNGQWLSWPNPLRLSILTAFSVAWETTVTSGDGRGADTLICGFGRAGIGLHSFLERLEAEDVEHALIGFYEFNSKSLMQGKLSNNFWADFKEESAPLIEWFGSPKVVQIINRHYRLT